MLTAIIGSSATTGILIALAGIAVVLVVSAVFYAIGRGEDRDRAQATRASSSTFDDDTKAGEDPARPQREPAGPEHDAPASRSPPSRTRPPASTRPPRRR